MHPGAEMPEKVSVNEDLGIIQVDSHGEVTEEDLMGSLKEIVRISSERGIKKVFVDATSEESLPRMIPLHEFGSELASVLRDVQFAVAVAKHLGDDLSFLETVTNNRGMRVAMFDSTDAALAWLRED